jgi:fatty acid desaturase
MTFEDEEEQNAEELPERATPLLAVVRIISVLGMAFGVSFGLFMALGFWWVPAILSFASAIPFFFLMRFMEKKAMEHKG